jgi:pimeloyl-ACP methyl ester carboxylesterase
MTKVNDRVLGRLYPRELMEPVIAGGYWFAPTSAAWREVMGLCAPGQLREVDCPVLVVGGAFDQLMVDARRYARAAPHGRVQVVPRAGHFVGFDQPDVVTALLVDVARQAGEAAGDAAEVVADGTLSQL